MKPLLIWISITISVSFASDWKKMHGQFVTLQFNPGYEHMADSLIDLADKSIPRLAALHGLTLSAFEEEKIDIILTAAPDIPNGYAMGNSVVIYVRSSMFLDSWSGPHTWYKSVLEHEIVHTISFRVMRRKNHIFGLAFSSSAPRWFYEGIAQYFAESWTSFRGDIYLKNAVLSGKLNYNALFDLNNGSLLYAGGHAFIRYLADQYGDSSLINLMQYGSNDWIYKFDEAFRKIYGKSVQDIFSFFLRHMIIYYGEQAAHYTPEKFSDVLPRFGFRDLQIIPLSPNDSTYLVATILEENHLYKTALIYRIKNGVKEILKEISDNFSTRLFISPDENYVAFGRWDRGAMHDQLSSAFKWFVYDRGSDKLLLVADNTRSFNAAFTINNDIILAAADFDSTYFFKVSLNNLKKEKLFTTEMPVGTIAVDTSGTIFFEGQQTNSQRDLFYYEDGKVTQLTDDAPDNRRALIINSRLIIFNQMIGNQPVISFLNTDNKTIDVKINTQSPLYLAGYEKRRHRLIAAYLDPLGKPEFVSFSIDSLTQKAFRPAETFPTSAYASWTTKSARPDSLQATPTAINTKVIEEMYFPHGYMTNLLTTPPLPVYDEKNGAALLFTTLWLEPLQRQLFFLSTFIDYDDWNGSAISLLHNLVLFDMNFSTFYYHGPGIITRENSQFVELVHDFAYFEIRKMRYFDGNPRTPYFISAGFTGDRFNNIAADMDYSYHGPSVSIGGGYYLPSKYSNIFPKKSLSGSIAYFKSMAKDYDFSLVNTTLMFGSNIYSEKLGLVSRFNYTQTNGSVPPSAETGIDQDYQLNLPRDYRNTKTIRGVSDNFFGDRLLWNSTELSYLLAQYTHLKLLFLPINEVAVSGFFDSAHIENDAVNRTYSLYSYGAELSFGFGPLRAAGGYAQGNVNGKTRNGAFYMRISIIIDNLMNGTMYE